MKGFLLTLAGSGLLLGSSVSAEDPPPTSTATVITPAPAPLPASKAPFTVMDVQGLSGMILFGATVDGKEGIYVLDLDGRQVRAVVNGPGNNSYPSWSPDGRRFVFSSDRDGNREIYVADWDGANQTRLTHAPGDDDNPAWSPVSDRVVYYSEAGDVSNIFMLDVSNPKPIQVTQLSGRNTTPRFSADGKSVTYSTNRFWPGWDVCAWNLRTKRESCLLKGIKTYCRQDHSPDGTLLAYSTGVHEDVDVGILNLANGQTTTITSMPGREYDVQWSPDGKFLAFTAEDGRKEVYNLYLVSPEPPKAGEERKVRQLVASPHSIRFLSWSSAKAIELEAERMRALQGG